MSGNQYLIKQHNTWICVVNIPPALRGKMKRTRFRRSLMTSNLNEANRLKLPVVAEFKDLIEAARSSDPTAVRKRQGSEWRKDLFAASTKPGDNPQWASERETLESAVDQIADTMPPDERAAFLSAAKVEGVLIKDYCAIWAAEVEVAEQTRVQHKSTLARYLEWAGELTTVQETTRLKAGEYVGYLIAKSGLARRTIKRHLSSLSQFWEWLESRGLAGDNVWLRHKLGKKAKSTTTRIGLSDELILKLLNGRSRSKKFEQLLTDLLRLALLTGARLDELCAVKRSEVHKREDGYWITVSDGKTDAAIRDIPLHESATPIIERRLKGKDEYLFAGLIPGGPDSKRSWYVSKAYARFRGQVGVDGKWQDFHALRNTFISMMEGLEIPESTVKLIVGHKRVSMTYGHYSKGKRVELRGVIDRLDYGAPIMAAIRSS